MSYCPRCGSYQPMRLNESGRLSCKCDRTPPIGDVPVNVFACPMCGGHGSSRLGCWGSQKYPHKHCYMKPVYELVRELRDLKASVRS